MKITHEKPYGPFAEVVAVDLDPDEPTDRPLIEACDRLVAVAPPSVPTAEGSD